ncbi:MAG: beta-ketoacyl-[acyl-carrier-protein] synthase II [Dethiobacter sp.]|nr:MAG: beta-ketoacyl-[acyl-carrier-protein] synthase II [Dethiobacter sp.]
MDKKVVVTGIGVVTPIGIGKEAYWENLKKGKSGVKVIDRFRDFPTYIAAVIDDFDPQCFMEKRDVKKTDRFTQFAQAAAKMAIEDAALDLENEDKEKIGVIVGSGIGGLDTIEKQFKILLEKGPRRISPFLVPMLIANMASGYISIVYGLKGPNSTTVTACASGTHAIGEAFRILQRGEADVMIAGGAEAPVTFIAFAGFCAARAMSTCNEMPEKASRPFDQKRDGFVMGEGAGILVLETMEHALKRKAFIYGEIVGYGMSGDGYHVTAPDPEGQGAYLCMERALKNAGLSPADVDYINAHGTSTEYNDKIETLAIKRLFNEHAYRVPISSTKSMLGHLLGAAGGVEMVATLLSMQYSIVPPTINYEYEDPDCDLFYVPNKVITKEIKVAMSNSFGFGGTNACLVVRKNEQEGRNS